MSEHPCTRQKADRADPGRGGRDAGAFALHADDQPGDYQRERDEPDDVEQR
ncbi:MAG: hypothetical protein QOI18_1711 [Solirubrobacteraceae bacterium]|nr:hypothetical protein [Solirubrobacteraceae bacterium]